MSAREPQPRWARLRSLHSDESGVISLLTVFCDDGMYLAVALDH